jgi:23S rRNA (guanosine2251-2'-O)-methyltransferase
MEKEQQQQLIFGTRPLIEALQSGKEIEKVFVQKGLSGNTFKELMPLLKENGVPYQVVPKEKLNRITRKNHQGIIAAVSPVSFYDVEQIIPSIYERGESPFILILDKVTDVRNFGAILRTAHSAGVHAVVIPDKNSAQLNSGTVKSSAGAIYKLPLCRVHNLKDTILFLKESGLKVFAATEKAEKNYFEEDFSEPLALIMGSEGEGISPAYLKLSDKQIKIPMLGEIASLNVSAATAVLLYEVVRQRFSV